MVRTSAQHLIMCHTGIKPALMDTCAGATPQQSHYRCSPTHSSADPTPQAHCAAATTGAPLAVPTLERDAGAAPVHV